MSDSARNRLHGIEQLRIARVFEAHGDNIGAILAYAEVIRDGVEPAARHARLRVAALARGAEPADPA